jgi:hypothetical protein
LTPEISEPSQCDCVGDRGGHDVLRCVDGHWLIDEVNHRAA